MLLCSLLFAFNAEALFAQKASKALSFKNVANDNRGKVDKASPSVRSAITPEKTLEHHMEPPMTENVDLTNTDSLSVSLKANDTLIIQLDEPEDGYFWDIETSGTGLSRVSEKISDSIQSITYKLNNSKSSNVFIDYVNRETNEIEKTKMLTIKLR